MLKGVQCPIGTSTAGECMSWEQCLNRRCSSCLPYSVRRAIYKVNKPRDRWFSPSAITGCLRKAKWEYERDYYASPFSLYAAMRGSLIHEILEKSDTEKAKTELTTQREIKGTGILLKGTIDRLENGILTDYKTMSDGGFNIFISQPRAKKKHIWQTNIYRWLLALKYNIKKIRIVYLGMNNVAVTGEKITYNRWGLKTVYDLEPCPYYTDDRVFDYLEERANIVKKSDTPPADSSEAWLCSICPFEEECSQYLQNKTKDVVTKLPF